MSKISNVLTMIQLLQSGRKYSINELSKELEVSERMIRIYKEDLEKAGIYNDGALHKLQPTLLEVAENGWMHDVVDGFPVGFRG